MRYAIRDPESGKFIRLDRINWKEVEVMNTIDNETQEDVTQVVEQTVNQAVEESLPTIGGDPVQIRSAFSKLADGIIAATNFGTLMKELEAKNAALQAQLAKAEEDRAQAQAERNAAQAGEASAKADAKMARDAYVQAENGRVVLHDKLEMYSIEIAELQGDIEARGNSIIQLETEAEHTRQMLDLAREERDRFREGEGAARADAEAAVRHSDDLLRENSGLHSKVNFLEDDNKRLGNLVNDHKAVLTNFRRLLGMEEPSAKVEEPTDSFVPYRVA